MKSKALERIRSTSTQNTVKSTFSAFGMLLALDGRCLDRLALPQALHMIKRFGGRLDILLLNPPKPATQILGHFLQQLEAAGIDYRLTSGNGNLAEELPLYVHRFKYISCVVLDCLERRESNLIPPLDALRHEGYQVLTLLDQSNNVMISSAKRG